LGGEGVKGSFVGKKKKKVKVSKAACQEEGARFVVTGEGKGPTKKPWGPEPKRNHAGPWSSMGANSFPGKGNWVKFNKKTFQKRAFSTWPRVPGNNQGKTREKKSSVRRRWGNAGNQKSGGENDSAPVPGQKEKQHSQRFAEMWIKGEAGGKRGVCLPQGDIT